MSGQCVDDTDRVKGDLLEREAEALVGIFNDAAPEYAPDLEWFGMGLDHDTLEQSFVLEATDYIDADGLEALRECGRPVRYIEAYEFEGEIGVQIQVPVQGDVPDRSVDTDTDRQEAER